MFFLFASIRDTLVVIQSPHNVTVTEGDTVQIQCCWNTNVSRATVHWHKQRHTEIKYNGLLVNNSQCHDRASQQTVACNCSHWTISNLTRIVSGTYICKVTIEIPSLIESVGNGTQITVTARENKSKVVIETSEDIAVPYTLRCLPVIILVAIFCYYSYQWKKSQCKSVNNFNSERLDPQKYDVLNNNISTTCNNFKYIYFFILPPFFSPISWYPIVSSYYLVSSLQLPYGLGRDEGREPCVLRNTTQLLLNTARIQPGSQPHHCVRGNTVHLATWSACTAPGPPQESLVRDETRISLPAKPSLTRTTLGQLCVAPWTSWSRPAARTQSLWWHS
ncbi:uncharacterized protein [Salvelinus alpinus]|uniref:uncharacterized protein n=1 Tax=Salvelinus alpinus TaxID=8036 RepID=UPI0039FD2DCC